MGLHAGTTQKWHVQMRQHVAADPALAEKGSGRSQQAANPDWIREESRSERMRKERRVSDGILHQHSVRNSAANPAYARENDGS